MQSFQIKIKLYIFLLHKCEINQTNVRLKVIRPTWHKLRENDSRYQRTRNC